jgi:hypothetical membrane protein
MVKSHPATVGAESSRESRAIYAAYISGILGFLVGLLCFWNKDVTLFEKGMSLGFVGSILGGVIAFVTFLIVMARQGDNLEATSWWGYVKGQASNWSLGLVHGFLVFMSYALMFYVVAQSFIGAHIDMWAASFIIALSTGFAGYLVYLSAATMNSVRVSILTALFLASGTFLSMLTASNPYWWDDHFSSLGAGGGVSGYAFNLTLIIAGLVIVALSRYITSDFGKLRQEGRVSQKAKVGILQALLVGIGIALAFVGLFVYDEFPTIHNVSAGGMAILFLAIVVLLPFITPGFTLAFFAASYSLLLALFVSVWLFMGIHYMNLTVFELVAAAIIFTWVVVFVRHVAALLNDTALAAKKGKV